MISDELQQRINDLEDERIQLKSILADRYKLSESVETAIRSRIELLNGLLASDITGNDKIGRAFFKLLLSEYFLIEWRKVTNTDM